MKNKFLFILAFTFFSQLPLAAEEIKHIKFNFPLNVEKFKKKDINYAYVEVDRDTFLKNAGPFSSMLKNKKMSDKQMITLFRAAFTINRPIGHFDSEKFNDIDFVKKLEFPNTIKKIKDNTYIIKVPKPESYQYFTRFNLDADDISSLPSSHIGRAINDLRNSDPLIQSAGLGIYKEYFGFSNDTKEMGEFYGVISLDEKTSLILFVKLIVTPPDSKSNNKSEGALLRQVKQFKSRIE